MNNTWKLPEEQTKEPPKWMETDTWHHREKDGVRLNLSDLATHLLVTYEDEKCPIRSAFVYEIMEQLEGYYETEEL